MDQGGGGPAASVPVVDDARAARARSVRVSASMSVVYEREPRREPLIFEFLVLKLVYPPIFSVIRSFLVFSHLVCLYVRFWERTKSRGLDFWNPRPKISLPSNF